MEGAVKDYDQVLAGNEQPYALETDSNSPAVKSARSSPVEGLR